ncbi:MAG: marine proteobacterial sortase target protein [Halieaceae bacterium]|jgi:Ca-activated chloride channel family protein|nr:marine proteobacterial sortase target protein [Halieaceae bacterium]
MKQQVYIQLSRDAQRIGGLHLWCLFRALPVALATAVVLMLLWVTPARATSGEGGEGALAQLASGQLLFAGDQPGHYTPAIMLGSKVHFDISGMIATVEVEQAFRNDSGRALEGVYGFPLPDNAAVRHMEMVIGERRIVGKIREKAEAQKIYREAKSAGKKASLVEQQRPNLFTNRVANINAGETVVVRLEYVQQLSFDNGEFSLRFPTTLTPRYMPGQPVAAASGEEEPPALAVDPYLGWALPTDQVPDADAISPLQYPQAGDEHRPLNPLELSVRLDMGMPLARVDAPYHDIVLARRAQVYTISLAAGVTEMDRDFVLTWQPVSGAAPTAALFTENVDGEYFGLLMVLPPAAERAAPAPPRELVFVVDTSGSMGGIAIAQARDSVSRALRELRPEDHFNIIEFNSTHRALYRRPVPATRHHVQQAQQFVRQLQATGGTEMLPALRAALDPQREAEVLEEQLALRQVIFITDGAVGNEVALFEEISARLGDSRLFTVGIGSAPNSWFMREAARFGRGSHTHIGSLDEVGDKMAALFARLSQAAVVDLDVTWPATAQAGQVEAWPERLPDLYLGEPLLVSVSFGPTRPLGEVVVSGDIAGRPWRQVLQLADEVDPATTGAPKGVASLWARAKIRGLMDQIVLGRSEDAVRSEVLPIALQHQLLSPYTSFVAVEEVVSLPPGERAMSVPVPNTRPLGQTPQTFAYPRTATTGPARAWLGMLLLFIATLVWVMRQPELDHVPTSDN